MNEIRPNVYPIEPANAVSSAAGKKKRKGLSVRLRFEIFKDDEFTCRYCGRQPPQVVLHVDHVVPVAEGGGNERSNLVTSCMECNSGKGAIPLTLMPAPVVDMRAVMAEREAQERAYIQFVKERQVRVAETVDEIGSVLFGDGWTFSDAAARSCRYFLGRLPFDQVLTAAELAATRAKRPFKYFCAVCWRLIRGE